MRLPAYCAKPLPLSKTVFGQSESDRLSSLGLGPVCSILDDAIAPIRVRDDPRSEPSLTYRYKALEGPRHIRLLRFSRRRDSSHLSCDLAHVSLDEHPVFYAVSYCWGTDQGQSGLVMSDNNHISISNVALRMLQRLIGTRDDITLWVDAICINQGDNAEKGPQVALMGDIYSNATAVLAWLGDSHDDESVIAQWMSRIYSPPAAELAKEGMVILGELGGTIHLDRDLTVDEQMILRMMDMPWFTRTWVIQEASLARSLILQYGRCSFSWPFLLGVLSSVLKRPDISSSFINIRPTGRLSEALNMGSVIEQMRVRIQDGDEVFLVELVTSNMTFGATDPRDKIYGGLGLERGVHATRLVPDYTATPTTVYRKATEALLYQGMGILAYAGLCWAHWCPSALAGQLPSWVPDFSQQHPIPRISSTWQSISQFQLPEARDKCWEKLPEKDDQGYSIAFQDGSRQPDEALDRVLRVPGSQVDIIAGMGPEPFKFTGVDDYDGTHKEAMAKYLSQCLELVEGVCRRFSKAEAPSCICEDVLQVGRRDDDAAPSNALLASIKMLRKSRTRVTKDYIILPDNNLAPRVLAFMERLGNVGVPRYRRLCWTKEGRVGLAPDIAKEGDLVVMLGDMAVPLVLRTCVESIHSTEDAAPSTSLYQLVGEIYINGFAEEAVSNVLGGKSKEQDFALW